MSASSSIPVVCAVIERDGRVLVAQRPAHKHLGLKWEFPGGKVEPGETPEAALAREIGEELACPVELVCALPRCAHAYTTVAIEMIPFVCRLPDEAAPPQPREHAALRWLAPHEFESIDLAEADWPVVASYRTWLGTKASQS